MRAPSSLPYFAAGAVFGISSLACPCPTCLGGMALVSLRGLAEHLPFAKTWMDERWGKEKK